MREAFGVREFCACYGICRATFYDELRLGRIKAKKLGRKTIILRKDAEKWAASLPALNLAVTAFRAKHFSDTPGETGCLGTVSQPKHERDRARQRSRPPILGPLPPCVRYRNTALVALVAPSPPLRPVARILSRPTAGNSPSRTAACSWPAGAARPRRLAGRPGISVRPPYTAGEAASELQPPISLRRDRSDLAALRPSGGGAHRGDRRDPE